MPSDREVSVTTFTAALLAEIQINGGIDLELRALDWLFSSWLPRSGYAPAHQPMFEAFSGRPFAHGSDYFELRSQLAVVPIDSPL